MVDMLIAKSMFMCYTSIVSNRTIIQIPYDLAHCSVDSPKKHGLGNMQNAHSLDHNRSVTPIKF